MIVQFESAITRQDLADLRRAGAVPLRYVPENAMAVSADASFDPASLPRARWTGSLTPADRISAGTAADLERPFPVHPLTVIEFQPDVTAAQAAVHIAGAGTSSLPGAALPAHIVMVPTDRAAIERLASDSAVAWIYPATSDLSAGAALCQGIVAPEGIVAEYAVTGEGWDGPGHGSAPDLGYFVSSTSPDLSASLTQGEIGRALAEWSRVIDVTFTTADGPFHRRSLTILWGPRDHGDGFPFDPQVLAHAFYPAPLTSESAAGDIHFNDGVSWGAGDASRYDVFSIMLHETGHSLGLTHSSDPEAVMYPMYRGIVSGLTATDVAAARLLYSAPAASLSSEWTSDAIGNVGGGVSVAEGRFRIQAAGRDVWHTSDELRFVSRTLDGDGDIIARVDALAGVHSWSKAGVMIRASTDPGAPNAFMVVSHQKGLVFQRRRTADGLSTVSASQPGAAPRWVRLSRRGDRLEAFSSVDGGTWTHVGSDTIPMGQRVLAGIALTSHDPNASAVAEFSNVSLTSPSPVEWSSADIGLVASRGSLTVTATQMRVTGAGADVWGTADAFHYAWQTLAGDGEIIARVASVQNTDRWAKAGVMIRASTDPGAAHAFMFVSPGKGYAFQRRVSADGVSVHTSGGSGTAPQWVRLRRTGNTLTGARSVDGVTWTTIGSATIAMGTNVLIGLAVTSHTTSSACESVFDNVTIR
jgi:regulation of enolase protein 1 (concanavalin A-like superfamily)